MATHRHPVTGVELNPVPIIRDYALSEDEKRTGELLQYAGDARWLAAQKLGAHPLAIPGIGRNSRRRRKTTHGHLPRKAAFEDARQISASEWMDLPEQLPPARKP